MSKTERLFRNSVFGGFNKDDVIDYIENMKNEFFEYRSQVEKTIKELNEQVAALTEEALAAKKEADEAVASSKAAVAAAEKKVAQAEEKSAETEAKTEPCAADEINNAADKLRKVADELCDSLTGFLDRIAGSSVAVTIAQPEPADAVAASAPVCEKPTDDAAGSEVFAPSKEKEEDIVSFIDSILNTTNSEKAKEAPAESEPSLLDSLLPDRLFN